jgi:hypothetical protein
MLNQPPIVVGMGGGDKQRAVPVAGRSSVRLPLQGQAKGVVQSALCTRCFTLPHKLPRHWPKAARSSPWKVQSLPTAYPTHRTSKPRWRWRRPSARGALCRPPWPCWAVGSSSGCRSMRSSIWANRRARLRCASAAGATCPSLSPVARTGRPLWPGRWSWPIWRASSCSPRAASAASIAATHSTSAPTCASWARRR